MIAARLLVVVVIVLDKIRSVLRQRVDDAACSCVFSALIVLCSLGVDRHPCTVARFLIVFAVKITVARYARHIVHGRSNCRFDSCVNTGSLQCHAAPAANAYNSDALRIDVVLNRQKINSRLKILYVDIRRMHCSGKTAGFSRKRRVEGNGEKSTFRHRLGIQTGGLFFTGSERSADGNRRQFSLRFLGNVHIGRKRNAKVIDEGHLPMAYLVAFGKYLVPLGCQFQFFCFHHDLCRLS